MSIDRLSRILGMRKAFALYAAFFAFTLLAGGFSASPASACTANDFGEVVDQTAQALRELNASGAQRFQAKLKEFQQKYRLSDEEIRVRAAELQDDKMTDFNREIDTLVAQMDELSQTPNEQINCEKLEELKRVRDRLLTVMGQKSGYMLAKADLELDRPAKTEESTTSGQPTVERGKSDVRPSPSASADRSAKQDKLVSNARAPAQEPREVKPAGETIAAPALIPDLPQKRPNQTKTAGSWQTQNQIAPPPSEEKQAYADPAAGRQEQNYGGREEPYANREAPYSAPVDGGEPPVSLAPPPDVDRLPPPSYGEQFPPRNEDVDTTYSIEEISEAGRGIFGTVTAQFAAAINYAFQNFGRPNAYITGSEGGAAFLAGLRYGKGKLYSKVDPLRTIYWQGPSVGLDMGAEGSSALFLVYNLDNSEKLYGRFTGIGGSAYVAGGVGLNVLGKGGVIIVPIRTGIGLRLGANLAYLKFTERQTWNPF
jgi:hypothetical protein